MCQKQTFCIAANNTLFDHLIGAREQRRWHSHAECLGGLQVDNERELRRLLDRKVGGLGAFENTIDIGRRLAELRNKIEAVRD